MLRIAYEDAVVVKAESEHVGSAAIRQEGHGKVMTAKLGERH
jgi:hypothetical protein